MESKVYLSEFTTCVVIPGQGHLLNRRAVSGANRGLGYGLVEKLITKRNVVIFAGVRDLAAATALNELAADHKNLHVMKLTSAGKADNVAAAELVEKLVGKVDVLMANAVSLSAV